MVRKLIRCTLSQKGIEDTIASLKDLDNKLLQANDKACRRIAQECATMMWEKQNKFITRNKDASGYSSVSRVLSLDNKYIAELEGSQVIYNEFGTGDPGAAHPHPRKNIYHLNPYLSGRYIKTRKDGSHYWLYNWREYEGVPSGRFVYNTVNNIKSKTGPKILKEEVAKVLSSGGDK